jgi:hypothetical protein
MNDIDETSLASAGEMARSLNRSTYGVKKALSRLGIQPKKVIGGISYFERETAMARLAEQMRSPNSTKP